jgi:thioredoxin 1
MVKKIFIWILFGLLAVLLISAFFVKDVLNDFVSEKMKNMVDSETSITAKELIETHYNYSSNGLSYEFTLLEFGATGCTVCKRMEGELDKVKNTTSNINVVFINTMFPENQNMVKYMGIAAIPMQVILDKTGNEIFKHYGFITAEDLVAVTNEK